ncbi:MAG: DUF2097 domain-containing protein [Methanobacteriaceae archaeon]|nr:DUF2097 domain-containing protein [Methanobacteriaceae archaeon]
MKEIVLSPDEIIEYVRNEVKVNDILEISYNRVFAPGVVLGVQEEDPESYEGLILSLQLTGELVSDAVDIDMHKLKDEIIELYHIPGGDPDDKESLVIIEASL